MHSFEWKNPDPEDDTKVYINHNGDFSGQALITMVFEGGKQEFWVPCDALVKFGKNARIDRAIEILEGMIE